MISFVRHALLATVLAALLPPAPVVASDLVTLNIRDAALTDVILLISRQGHLNVVPDGSVLPTLRVGALTLTGISPRSALTALEQAYGLKEIVANGYIRILPGTELGRLDIDNATTTTIAINKDANPIVVALGGKVPGVVLLATPSGKAIVASGTTAGVRRARELIAALTNDAAAATATTMELIGVSNSTASDLAQKIEAAGYSDGSGTLVIPDDSRNRLMVRSSPEGIRRVRDVVAMLDVPLAQVTFDVQVLDVSNNTDHNVGLLFGGKDANGKIGIGSTFTQFANTALPFNVTLNALLADGTAQLLARPSVSVVNGKAAKILVGAQYPLAINNGALLGGGSNIQFVQIGVQLQFTPIIGADGTITTDLTTTYSEISGVEPVSNYPIIAQRTVQSYIPVKDGQPIILAGLFQDVRGETVKKVPLLGDVPVFGPVFRNRERTASRDEIIFALYPHLGVRAAGPAQPTPAPITQLK